MDPVAVTTFTLHGLMPLCERLGVEVESAAVDSVRLALAWQPELCTGNGVLHGGAMMAVADSAGATCAFLNLPEGATTATIESIGDVRAVGGLGDRYVRDLSVMAGFRPRPAVDVVHPEYTAPN